MLYSSMGPPPGGVGPGGVPGHSYGPSHDLQLQQTVQGYGSPRGSGFRYGSPPANYGGYTGLSQAMGGPFPGPTPVLQGYGYGGPAPYRSHRGWCCRCGQDFSAIAPPWDPKELFVNVTVRDVEEHPMVPVKSLQSWIASTMGQVMCGGKNHFSHKIAQGHFQDNELGVKAEVLKVFLKRGWHSEVTTVLLPPYRGQLTASTHVQMTRDALPIFMVFRVQLAQRYWAGSWHCQCTEKLPFHRAIGTNEWPALGKEIEEALQQNQYMRHLRRPVKAEINVADAAEEMHVLYNMHWSEEQAADCIVQARRVNGVP